MRTSSVYRKQNCRRVRIFLDLPGYHQYWNYAEKKGYSGTAIFAKKEPLSVRYGIGVVLHDTEGACDHPRIPVVLFYHLLYTKLPERVKTAFVPYAVGR